MKIIELLNKYRSADELVEYLIRKQYKVRDLDLTVSENHDYANLTRKLFYFFKSLVKRHHRIRYRFYNVNYQTEQVISEVCQYIGVKKPIII